MTRDFHPGMGRAVAERTILRPGEGWGDVADRVALGNTLLHPTGKADKQGFRKHLHNATILMSGRHLQHGDKDQPNRNLEVFSNCGRGDTRFLTQELGITTLEESVGRVVTVRTADGSWRPAEVKAYGRQELFELEFERKGSGPKTLRREAFTANHRWLLADGSVTEALALGDVLKKLEVSERDPEAVVHGLIFGDGTGGKRRADHTKVGASQGRTYASIRVCKQDKVADQIHELLDRAGCTFTTPVSSSGDRWYYIGKLPYAKDVPFTRDPEYISGFIYGWWLADGHKTEPSGTWTISTADAAAAEWLTEHAAFAGLTVLSHTLKPRTEGDGSYPNGKDLHIVRLREGVQWRLARKTSLGEAAVYCVEEPVTKSFTLASGLVTGNCSTSAASYLLFYLLLNGSGVGRSYDDDMMVVNWDDCPTVRCVLDEAHPDFDYSAHESVRDARHKYGSGESVHWFVVPDSREGWGQAIEQMETMAFQKAFRDDLLVLDFSDVRCKNSPIAGMQNRPSSGPVPMMNALHKIATLKGAGMPKWMQAMYVDHYLAEPVLVGGARRAARMAVKIWSDKSVLDFITVKRPLELQGLSLDEIVARKAVGDLPYPFLWSSNNSIGVTKDFWRRLALKPEDQGYNAEMTRHARAVHKLATECAYADGTGEPGYLNLDMLTQKDTGQSSLLDGSYVGSKRYQITDETRILMAALAKRAAKKPYWTIVNPCGEIPLAVYGGYCVIADNVPFHADTFEEVLSAGEHSARALIRVNLMDNLYAKETARTNRIGVGQTGVHEFAWKFFKVGFHDLVRPDLEGYAAFSEVYKPFVNPLQIIKDVATVGDSGLRAAAFWEFQGIYSRSTMRAAFAYADEIGVSRPHTVTTIKPAGTTSKLFGLSEGWHLPAMALYLRWVQFRHDDPLVAKYQAEGYPVRHLTTYEGTTIVGFPTEPTITTLGMEGQLVLAGDATPQEQYDWLKLGEYFWIEGGCISEYLAGFDARPGEDRHGGQISYTLKYKFEDTSYEAFLETLTANQGQVRACSVMPETSADNSAYEYLPEEPVTKAEFEAVARGIRNAMAEDVDKVHVDCASGVCPVDFNKA